MQIACWIPTVTNTRSEYVTFVAFPLQQWLHECGSILHYMYIACLVPIMHTCDCTQRPGRITGY